MLQRSPIHLAGSPEDRGHRLGLAQKAQISHFLGEKLARLNYGRSEPLTREGIAKQLRAYGDAIAASTPRLWREIVAFSEAAEISREDAILLQTRREMMGYTRFPAAGDCTSLVRVKPQAAFLAQTVDLTGEMQEHIQLLHLAGEDIAGGRAIIVSFTGLLGYLGMNAAGLAVGLNLVLAGDWAPGLPPYLAIRHLIDRAHSVEEGIEILSGLPLASSRNFVLCDCNSAAMVEYACGRFSVMSAADLCHANHFVDPDFAKIDALNVFAQNSSRARHASAEQVLAEHPGHPSARSMLNALSAAPINVQGARDMTRERTVAAVMMSPRAGEMVLRRGDPAHAKDETFTLSQPVRATA